MPSKKHKEQHADPPCDRTECEEICASVRGKLIENFGVPPEQVDCTDPMWVGDCAHCSEVLRREFEIVPEACP